MVFELFPQSKRTVSSSSPAFSNSRASHRVRSGLCLLAGARPLRRAPHRREPCSLSTSSPVPPRSACRAQLGANQAYTQKAYGARSSQTSCASGSSQAEVGGRRHCVVLAQSVPGAQRQVALGALQLVSVAQV